ncbi:MAG: cellulase family glycosylhydrolase [Opitutales bacterium]|jgi:aryl-phospho-beta-D-glucosidase BglC (GH1 family)
MKRLWLFLCLFLPAFAHAQNTTNGVPPSLLDHLTTGINLTRWFGYVDNPDDTSHFQNYLSVDDFANFQRLGIHFVRLCVTPKVIDNQGQPKAAALAWVDWALDWLQAADIAVIFDLHDNGELKLDTPGQDNTSFVSFWQAIAKHYQGRRENLLIFELVNEPVFRKNPETWYALQEKTVQAIRAIDPARTIMVSGTDYSSIDTLANMTPLPEKNLVYTFHCYDPFFFTHQGATWAGDSVKPLKDMPFPANPAAVDKMIAQIPAASQGAVRWYGRQPYDQTYLLNRLKKAVDWGKQNGVPVVLGEYGAYALVSPPDSRARWFAAMRSALTQLNLPNSLWGYDDSFGLGRRRESDGSLWLDPVTLQNLYNIPPAQK